MIALPPPGITQATASITALLEARTGQQIAPGRAWRVETALKPLLREHGLHSLDQLALAVRRGQAGLDEAVVEALLNHESSFCRDGALFEQIGELIAARGVAAPERRQRIWSIGCSHGQEPLSLAMMFEEQASLARDFPEILATDVSVRAVDRARAGRFSQFEVQRGLSVRRLIRWLEQDEEQGWQTSPALQRRITYRVHNIVEDTLPPGRFDLILCRNVLLYFAPALRSRVLGRLAQALREDGLLMLGAGETVIGQTDQLEPSPDWRGLYRLRRG